MYLEHKTLGWLVVSQRPSILCWRLSESYIAKIIKWLCVNCIICCHISYQLTSRSLHLLHSMSIVFQDRATILVNCTVSSVSFQRVKRLKRTLWVPLSGSNWRKLLGDCNYSPARRERHQRHCGAAAALIGKQPCGSSSFKEIPVHYCSFRQPRSWSLLQLPRSFGFSFCFSHYLAAFFFSNHSKLLHLPSQSP